VVIFPSNICSYVPPWIHPHVFLLVFHQLLPLTFFRGTVIFSWRWNTLQHTDSSESRNLSQSVSLRKTLVCSLNKQTCRRLMHKQKKITSMTRLCLSFDIHHFEIEELSFLTLWWDFRKEASFWHRFRLLILTRLTGLVLEPVSPETQAMNGHFQNYKKRSRFHGNYQNRRTSIFWLMVLSTKIDSACVQMFRAVSGTNGDGIWWHDGDGDVSNTE